MITAVQTASPLTWTMPWFSTQAGLQVLATRFEPISLREMEDVALLDRLDTKFILTHQQLLAALRDLRDDYWMLSVQGQRLNHYRTLYFDTPAFDLYHAHVNGSAERYKVRAREYADTRVSFLEVKHHTRKDRTVKDRLPTPQPAARVTPEMWGWLRTVAPLDGTELIPRLWNTFTRITLVGRHAPERVTLDVDLAFSSLEREVQLEGVAIAEVKVAGRHAVSPFLSEMRRLRIPRRGFSKYAVGVALLYDGVKKNSLKPRLLFLERLAACSPTYLS